MVKMEAGGGGGDVEDTEAKEAEDVDETEDKDGDEEREGDENMLEGREDEDMMRTDVDDRSVVRTKPNILTV